MTSRGTAIPYTKLYVLRYTTPIGWVSLCIIAYMQTRELEELIAGGETYTVEFKSEANDDELTEAVVCLANGTGGSLLIGVRNDGSIQGARRRHGHSTDARRLEALIANKTSPALRVKAHVEVLEGRDVIVIEVTRPNSLVATTSGRYVRRAIDVDGKPQCLPILPHEVHARVAELGLRDLSAFPLPELSADELDSAELDRFRRLAEGGGDEVLSTLSAGDLLSALGFRTVDGTLTVGAVLLFGTPAALRTFVPTHSTAFQVIDERDAVRTNRRLRVPLIRAMVELVDAIGAHNPEEEVTDGLFRLGLPLYSEIAIRELIGNALVHRDYTTNGEIRVAIEGATLSVSNPGGFPYGMTVDNLLTAPPQARNPLIADGFKRAGLVERVGRGINRVYRNQLALGRPLPDYSGSTRAWVEARLPAGPADREFAAYTAMSSREGQPLDLHTLQVLREVRVEGRITSARAGRLFHAGSDEARGILSSLVERGLLEARGQGRGRSYHLAAGVHRHLGDSAAYVRTRGFDRIQQEQMVLTYVGEHGSIARSDAAELCRMTPDQASWLLRRMVRHGMLEMVGMRRTARYRRPYAGDPIRES